MQEKKQKKSLIKQNISKYAKYKGISKYEIYQKTGISRSVLSQDNGMTEDNLLKFLAYYSDVNLEWLLTGMGEMLKNTPEETPPITEPEHTYNNSINQTTLETSNLLMQIIKDQRIELKKANEEIGVLKHELKIFQSQSDTHPAKK
jgi:hypothetical protein